jgi:hypothetical protein
VRQARDVFEERPIGHRLIVAGPGRLEFGFRFHFVLKTKDRIGFAS